MQTQLVSSHGMLAILEVLEGRCSRDVIMKLLQIINLVRFIYRLDWLVALLRYALHFSSLQKTLGFWKVSV